MSRRKEAGVLVRVHKMHKVPVRSKAMVSRKTDRTPILQIRGEIRWGQADFYPLQARTWTLS